MTEPASAGPFLRLVIVGSGFTGAVLALHAIRAANRPLDITVVEPAAVLGRGAAYGTSDPSHRINVPSDRMGLLAEDPQQATRWLFARGHLPEAGSDDGQGRFYVPRSTYRTFVADTLNAAVVQAASRLRFLHRRARAIEVTPGSGGGWCVACDDGTPHPADAVAPCFGHAAPCTITDAVARHPTFVPNPGRATPSPGSPPTIRSSSSAPGSPWPTSP